LFVCAALMPMVVAPASAGAALARKVRGDGGYH